MAHWRVRDNRSKRNLTGFAGRFGCGAPAASPPGVIHEANPGRGCRPDVVVNRFRTKSRLNVRFGNRDLRAKSTRWADFESICTSYNSVKQEADSLVPRRWNRLGGRT